MDSLIIQGGIPLSGHISPSGNKNAALPLLTACLLTEEPVIMHNVPQIRDVFAIRALLESLGVNFRDLGSNSWEVHAKDVRESDIDPQLAERIRASILLAGPMLARSGILHLPPPGGDVIGRRRVDTHLVALSALGAEAKYDRFKRQFKFKASSGLIGTNIFLDEASVTATENAIMAAVTAKGTTKLSNAASEPHVQDLCHFLNLLGARIDNIGSNTLIIEGVSKLHGGEYTIGPDYMEVVSYIGAAVVTNGSITIQNSAPEYLEMVRLVFNRMGVDWEVNGQDIFVPKDQSLSIDRDIDNSVPRISVMPWPGFPTDLLSIAIVVGTQAKGSLLFHDWMYEGRMYFTDKLIKMGAQIVLCDPHRCIVQGPTRLSGAVVDSPDIRAGLSLVLAALAAEGTSVIKNASIIDRGYERIDEKLKLLGANLERTAD